MQIRANELYKGKERAKVKKTKTNDIYAKFWRETLRFESPRRFGYDWFTEAISKVWDTKYAQVEWHDYELLVKDILQSPFMADSAKVELLNDALGAYTGRGMADLGAVNQRRLKETEVTK